MISQIAEVVSADRDRGTVKTRDLFRFDDATGRLAPTGRLPTFIDELVARGELDLDVFFP